MEEQINRLQEELTSIQETLTTLNKQQDQTIARLRSAQLVIINQDKELELLRALVKQMDANQQAMKDQRKMEILLNQI